MGKRYQVTVLHGDIVGSDGIGRHCSVSGSFIVEEHEQLLRLDGTTRVFFDRSQILDNSNITVSPL